MGDLRIGSAVILTLLVFGSGFGCKADRPGGDKPDAAVNQEMLLAPQIDTAVPMETPNDTVAVRGTTSGARIVVKGGPGDPVVKSVLPSGSFCADVTLNPTGPTPLTAYALDNGQISPPSGRTTSTYWAGLSDAWAVLP